MLRFTQSTHQSTGLMNRLWLSEQIQQQKTAKEQYEKKNKPKTICSRIVRNISILLLLYSPPFVIAIVYDAKCHRNGFKNLNSCAKQ